MDTTFGSSNGYVSHNSGGTDTGIDIKLDKDGKLVVLGRTDSKLFLWRMDTAGVSDNGFGTNGMMTISGTYALGKMAVDSQGRILVTGTVAIAPGNTDMALWRITTSGQVDTEFGADYDMDTTPDGYVLHGEAGGQSGDYDYGRDVIVDAAGNILVTGDSIRNNSGRVRPDMVVWRFTEAGVLDTSFASPNGFFIHNGAAGLTGINTNLDRGYSLVLDDAGKILIAGDSYNSGAEMALWKLR